jgi:hypothetical protein
MRRRDLKVGAVYSTRNGERWGGLVRWLSGTYRLTLRGKRAAELLQLK